MNNSNTFCAESVPTAPPVIPAATPKASRKKSTPKKATSERSDPERASGDAVANGSEPAILHLATDQIRTDAGTQPRSKISDEIVSEYAALMDFGVEFPPLDVYDVEGELVLVDGFHRFEACRKLGRKNVKALVRSGSLEEARWHSYGANKSHGLRRSQSDKREAVQQALKHPHSRQLSDSSIAKHVGVSPSTVGEQRRVLEESFQIEKIEERTATRRDKPYQFNKGGIGKSKKSDSRCANKAPARTSNSAGEDEGDAGARDMGLIAQRTLKAINEIRLCLDEHVHPTWLKEKGLEPDQVERVCDFMVALKETLEGDPEL